nr:hypothetical protein [Tanacetum cinerariifolium]
MAAPVIFISSDLSVESVRSSFPRVILIGSISVEVLVAPKVRTAVVASPVRVLELDTHSSSKADPSESSPPPVSVAPMILPFLCSNDSESDTKIRKRHVSPTPHDVMLTRWRSRVASRSSSLTTSTSEIPTALILLAPSAIVAPSSEFPLAPVALTARKSVRPLPSPPLALRYTSHHLDHFISGSSSSHSSSDHLSSGHSSSGHSLSGHTLPNTTGADSSILLRFVHPTLASTLWCREAYLRWRSAPLSTMYLLTTSESSAGDSSSESSAGPYRKRCRFRDSISQEDSVEEDINTDVLKDIKADAKAIEVAVDRDVEAEIDACIGIYAASIDIPDGMPMPDAVERLEQVEEGLQDIYDHVIEIPFQRIEDIETSQRELEARSLIAGGESASLLEQVVSLERSNNMIITRSGMTPEAIEELVNR